MRINEVITEDQGLTIIDAVRDFLPLAIKHLKLKELPKIDFVQDVKSKHDQPTFGVYHHNGKKVIELDIENRHPMDIIRTLAHELTHYKQDLEGRLSDETWTTGSPTENEAHEQAGIMMRVFDKQYPQYLKMKAVTFNENFADGKVKGKSRPGRVKKAGASCQGSVTSLRQKAKQGGERGKMYHWCANMKAGRNK